MWGVCIDMKIVHECVYGHQWCMHGVSVYVFIGMGMYLYEGGVYIRMCVHTCISVYLLHSVLLVCLLFLLCLLGKSLFILGQFQDP